jgi:uncharacterized protein YwgA
MVDDVSLLLATLYYSNREIPGRKRFQKIICILEYAHGIDFSYEFTPYHYGPFSESLSGTIDTLVGVGFLQEEKQPLNENIYQYTYRLTHEGETLARQSIETLRNENEELISKLSAAVSELRDMSTTDLVRLSKDVFIDDEDEEDLISI